MKNLLIALLFSTVTYSQSKPFDVVFGLGIDPKMALEGAHKDRPNNKPSLDIEASFGLEWENTRLLTKYKLHEAINFSKWTYLAFDYKRELFNNFYGFAVGAGLQLFNRFNLDLAYQLRYGRGVNSDLIRGIEGFEQDVLQHRVLLSTVVYF